MPNAWDIADGTLQQQLTTWRDFLTVETDYVMHLYMNDYTPIPGSAIGDYEESDFQGYAEQLLPAAGWDPVTVVNHVASTEQAAPCAFVADDTGFVSQDVFGYYVTDTDGAYLWGERFEVTRTILPEDTLNVTAQMRHGVLPA